MTEFDYPVWSTGEEVKIQVLTKPVSYVVSVTLPCTSWFTLVLCVWWLGLTQRRCSWWTQASSQLQAVDPGTPIVLCLLGTLSDSVRSLCGY